MEEERFSIKTTVEKSDLEQIIFLSVKNQFILGISLIIILSYLIYNKNIIYFICCSILATIIFLFIKLIPIKKYFNSIDISLLNMTYNLKFYDNKFICEDDGIKSYTELEYDKIFKLKESKNYFLLYLTNHQSFIIRKKDIEHLEEFSTFIISKFEGKYKKI